MWGIEVGDQSRGWRIGKQKIRSEDKFLDESRIQFIQNSMCSPSPNGYMYYRDPFSCCVCKHLITSLVASVAGSTGILLT